LISTTNINRYKQQILSDTMALKLDESVLSACKASGTSKGQKPVYLGVIKPEHDDYKFLLEAKADVEKKGYRFQEFVINAIKAASGVKTEEPKDKKAKDDNTKAE